MNADLDFFKLRSAAINPDDVTTSYAANRLAGGLRLGPRAWLDGALGERELEDTGGKYRYTSWQVAAQYQWMESEGWWPAAAVRMGAWGNYANATQSVRPVVLPGARLNSVTIGRPEDQQLQIDLIGSWNVTSQTQFSAIASAGRSQLSYKSLSARTSIDGCEYKLGFTGNAFHGVLASPCTGIYLKEIYDDSGALGINVADEIAWSANFVQLGFNSRWNSGPWTLRAGYLAFKTERKEVDSILASRGKKAYTFSHTVVVDAAYEIMPHWSVFASAQFGSNGVFNELPVSYNTSTASRFDSAYSLIGLGTRLDF